MVDWRNDFYEARYHFEITKRMLEVYDSYPEKRVLVGVIREGAKAAGKLVRSFLIREGVKGNLKIFLKEVAPKYLDGVTTENLVKMLEIEKAQRMSKVEFVRKDKIILLVGGCYRVLTVARLREFVDSVGNVIENFSADIKR